MQAFKTILREIYGLFVEDSMFALGILLWLAAVSGLSRLSPLHSPWAALLLFAGLAAILVESSTRYARNHPRKMRE